MNRLEKGTVSVYISVLNEDYPQVKSLIPYSITRVEAGKPEEIATFQYFCPETEDCSFIDVLHQESIPYDMSSRHLTEETLYTHLRFSATGKTQYLHYLESQTKIDVGKLHAHIHNPQVVLRMIDKAYKEIAPWPWDNQLEYSRKLRVLDLLQPHKRISYVLP